MSARWLLDVAALAQASRRVAQDHALLRGQQLTVYAYSSTLLARADAQAKTATTAGAAIPKRHAVPSRNASIPAADGTQGQRTEETGLDQDHHYDASPFNSSTDAKPQKAISVTQEKGYNKHLLAGNISRTKQGREDNDTIPAQVAKTSNNLNRNNGEFQVEQEKDIFREPCLSSGFKPSSSPRETLPEEAVTIQIESVNISDSDVRPDVPYSSRTEDSTGTGISAPSTTYDQLFQSQRVAQMLQGDQQQREAPYKRARQAEQQWPPRDRAVPADSQPASDVEEAAREIASVSDGVTPFQMRESRVPSSRFGRMWQYAGLGASMTFGAAVEGVRRIAGSQPESGNSIMLSSANMERLVTKLSRMRGAALKLGQILSFQDSKLLPPTIHQVLQRVQDSADYMPASQRDQVLRTNLGVDWRALFVSFDEQPMAAASIGQVHGAVIKSTGERVAVKIQYPGVADSISSDLNNLSILLTASRMLPKGLYLNKTIENARTELAWECDYVREAEAAKRFQTLLADEPETFAVPKIYDEACGRQVLTMQRMEGTAVTKLRNLSQEQKDWIGSQILRLCLREITEFKFMQTDPNWTNFLFNSESSKLELLDFGASREFSDDFIDPYARILVAASRNDQDACRDLSIRLGYLTGMESKAMLDAHIASITTLAEPFMESSPEVYDFRDQTITDRVRAFIPVMLRERLAPPPEETYSLHRKLSGAFLLLARLGARVRCKEMFANAMRNFEAR